MKRLLKILCAVIAVMVIASDASAMTDDQYWTCHGIIHGAATAAAGSAAVLAQVPGADNIPLALIVGGMAIALGKVFDKTIAETVSTAEDSVISVGLKILALYAGYIAARTTASYVIGWIPLIGNIASAASIIGIVELIGWDMVEKFDKGDYSALK